MIVGIDPGVKTGFAVYSRESRAIITALTLTAVAAEERIKELKPECVYIEDARLRQWKGLAGAERLKGVGSVERDCKRWQEFCEHHNISFKLVAPKNNMTKLSSERFELITGYTGRTSEHSRDAGMLVFGR